MKTELSTLDKVKKVLGMPLELAQMKLDDGVTVIEAEVFEAGQPVFIITEDGQQIPLPVNLEGYVLEDGMLLIVSEEGVIGEIREAGSEAPEEMRSTPLEQEKEVATSEKPTETPVAKKVVESVSKETYFTAEEKEALEAKIAELEAKVTELSKEEETVEEEVVEEVELAEQTVEPIKYNPENQVEQAEGFRFSQNRKETLQDRVRKSIFSK